MAEPTDRQRRAAALAADKLLKATLRCIESGFSVSPFTSWIDPAGNEVYEPQRSLMTKDPETIKQWLAADISIYVTKDNMTANEASELIEHWKDHTVKGASEWVVAHDQWFYALEEWAEHCCSQMRRPSDMTKHELTPEAVGRQIKLDPRRH
jgi:hypothetical protein